MACEQKSCEVRPRATTAEGPAARCCLPAPATVASPPPVNAALGRVPPARAEAPRARAPPLARASEWHCLALLDIRCPKCLAAPTACHWPSLPQHEHQQLVGSAQQPPRPHRRLSRWSLGPAVLALAGGRSSQDGRARVGSPVGPRASGLRPWRVVRALFVPGSTLQDQCSSRGPRFRHPGPWFVLLVHFFAS